MNDDTKQSESPESPVPGTSSVDQRQRGTVRRYIEDKGYGFIAREDGPDLFFHAKQCECSRLYDGESVAFHVVVSRDKEEAQSVCRVDEVSSTGDIIQWDVDPATRKGFGLIAPDEGGGPLCFSWQDLARPRGAAARITNPRPWHAARYRLAPGIAGGPRAVDIEIDWRYPLQRFAFLGDEEELVRQLKAATLDEAWDYRTSKSRRPHEILYNYLHFTFAKLVDEDRSVSPCDRKIRIYTDSKDHATFAAFNTGLVDQRYESVFALFERNEHGRQQAWKILDFCTAGEGAGKLLSRYFNPLPGPAQYFSHASELLFDPDAALHPDYTHILSDNRDRLPHDLVQIVEHLPPVKAENVLKMHIDRAIDLSRKRTRWNFKTAIPHYFPTFKRLELLLPLCLLDDSTVDVALAVQRTETGYIGSTILPLDWAYKSARLVCRPDSDWLAPAEIDAGEEFGVE
jgi:cold shock CspA family protein